MRLAWDDSRTAEMYERFTRRFPMYDETSRDLVSFAGVSTASRIVDLACGTGATTRAILSVAQPESEVSALDGSPAMIGVAEQVVTDRRVRWVCADACDLDAHVADVDVIVCNSAIWQFDMPRAFETVTRVLRRGGRFAFSVGRQFILLPLTEEELSPAKPSLWEYMQAVATLDYDYVAPFRGRSALLSEEIVRSMITDAGLRLDTFEIRSYDASAEQDRAWFEIPVFADNVLAGMPYEDQLRVIDKASRYVDPAGTASRRWAYFVASREP